MTDSELQLTQINNSVFFKEFTYSDTRIYGDGGDTKELADNIVWIDELLLAYQVKGRDPNAVKDLETELRWFENTVCGKAKKQIKDTISFFDKYHTLPVTNGRGHKIDIAQANVSVLKKLIIYQPNSNHLYSKRYLKFLGSSVVGNIHIFHIDDYQMVCKYLITPTELSDYLTFREELYEFHKLQVELLPEEYIISHYFTTSSTDHTDPSYLTNLVRINEDKDDFDLSLITENFQSKIVMGNEETNTQYHSIIKEIAKLHRQVLTEFKTRYKKILNMANDNETEPPLRFLSSKSACGFVFIALKSDKSQYWENALLNSLETYKYKHKLPKCLAVLIFKEGPFFEIRWAFQESPWVYDAALEKSVQDEIGIYPESSIKEIPWYKLNDYT